MRIDRRGVLSLLATALLAQAAHADALPLAELPGNVEAPDFAFPDLDGGLHRLSDYRGRPFVVAFWAVWCAPCRREIPALAELRARLADTRIEILAVNLGDKPERIAGFLKDYPAPDLPVLLDREKSAAASWHVRGLPVAYVVDRQGILRLGALGERDWRASVIEAQLRSLL
jgi:thiol-disulfide isomerase/thioredoxin